MEFIFIVTLLETAVVLIVIIVLLILAHLFGTRKKMKTVPDKLRTGMPVKARAIVLSMERTDVFTSQQQQVRLQVQVLPEKGRNFVTEIKELLPNTDVDLIKGGTVVSVFYNPVTMKEVTLIKAAPVIT